MIPPPVFKSYRLPNGRRLRVGMVTHPPTPGTNDLSDIVSYRYEVIAITFLRIESWVFKTKKEQREKYQSIKFPQL